MAIDFVEDAVIDFQPEEASARTLADFGGTPDAGVSESSPLTPPPPIARNETIADLPRTELDFALQQAPEGLPVARIGEAPATVPRFGAPGTMTRGVSETLGGLMEWALNRPEEAVATLTPLAPAIALRYAPEIAVQFGKDVAAGVRGDKEALGRALTMGALVGGPKTFAKAREGYLLRGEARTAPERAADVAAQLQQPGAPNLTGRDLRYLATTREPVIEEPPRVVSGKPAVAPGELFKPERMRTGEAQGVTGRPSVGIDIVNKEGVRFGPEFWDFQPTEQARAAAPMTAETVVRSGRALREHTTEAMREAERSATVAESTSTKEEASTVFSTTPERSQQILVRTPNGVRRVAVRASRDVETGAIDLKGIQLIDDATGTYEIFNAPPTRRPIRSLEEAEALGNALVTAKFPKVQSLPAAPPTPASEIIGMGGATPAEFASTPHTTATKNAVVDQERAARGLPPAIEPARRSFGAVWDEAMAIVDRDPAAQDKLLADLRANPRSVTDTENALLLHRQVDLQNDFDKAARELAQAVDDGRLEDAATLRARRADLSDRLLDLYDIGKKVGTETGRGLAARKTLANQDFTLARMVTERRAVNDGRPLTERQANETAQAHADISRAQHEAETRPSTEADFKLDRAKKQWEGKLADDADANAPVTTRYLMRAGNALNDVRTIVTSYDLSGLLRQGKLALATRPGAWARAIAPSIRAAASPLAAFRIDHEITQRPNARSGLYGRSGLYLAEAGHKLTGQEEAFLTRGLARRIPGVKASERAYTTFLNKLRADLFDTFVATLSRDGKTVTLPEAQVIANYINVMTGRGDLAKFNAAAVPMATVFFAPRYVASRFQYLLAQPLYYGALSGKVGWREGARARKLVAGEYARALIGLSAIYGLYAIASEQQNFDPYSSDFLKLRSGDTRLDPFAGLQQTSVLLSREIGGQKTTLRGKTQPIRGKVPYGGANAFDVATKFGRTKLSPIFGAGTDWLVGTDVVGNPVTPGSIALDLTVPISYQDILKTLEDQGMPRGAALTLLSLLGEGVQTHDEPRRTK